MNTRSFVTLWAICACSQPFASSAVTNEASSPLPAGYTLVDPHHLGALSSRDNKFVLEVQAGADLPDASDKGPLTSPRALATATGDFETVVTLEPLALGGEQKRMTGRLAAGLVLLKDERNFVRLDHSVTRDDSGEPHQSISFVQVQNGARTDGSMDIDVLAFDAEKPLQLRLHRNGNRLEAGVSGDGQKWLPIVPMNIATLPDRLQAGVFAVNTTTAPYAFQLANLAMQSGPSTSRLPPPFPTPEPVATLDPRAALFAPWGVVWDPSASAEFHVDGSALSVALAGVSTDLVRGNNRDNAPKILSEIDGDFVIETTIDPLPNPKGHPLGIPTTVWTSAGLIVVATERDHVHFEYAATNAEPAKRDRLVFSLNTADGESDGRNFDTTLLDSSLPVTLRIERRGDNFFGYASQNNIQICGGRVGLRNPWPTKLRAGLFAKNTTNLLFKTRFSNFKLTPGVAPIAEVLKLTPLPEPPAEALSGGWGQPIDPEHAASFTVSGDTLAIALNGTPTAFAGSKLNAPRTLSTASGDFIVKVLADPVPAPTGTSPQAMPNGAHRNAAGLLVMLNDGNFLRFDRALVIRDTGVTEPSLNESLQVQGVEEYGNKSDRFPRIDPSQPLWLQIQRRGAEFATSYSADGEHWQEMSRFTVANWPPALHVGAVAAGSTTQAFTARLHRLAVSQAN